MGDDDVLMKMLTETGEIVSTTIKQMVKNHYDIVDEDEYGLSYVVEIPIEEHKTKVQVVITLSCFCGVAIKKIILTKAKKRLTAIMLYNILSYKNPDGFSESQGGLFIDKSDNLIYRTFYPIRKISEFDFIFSLQQFANYAYELQKYTISLID
jgi:hypothetical protein